LLQKFDELFSFQVQPSMSDPNLATPIADPDPSNSVADPLRDRHECNTCGYVYLPLQGDERQGVAPRTAFADLPEKWRCPVCSASQRRFQNLGPAGSVGFKQNAKYGLGVNTLDPGKKNLLIFGSLFVFFLLFLSLYGLS
jgi:rubredoxin